MPPKPKFSREEIVSAAFGLMEERGMEAVVAREIAKRLNCTVAPIFTCFENMEELKAAVHARAMEVFTATLLGCVDYFPSFKEFGLRWVRMAREHPHVYSEVFLRKGGDAAGAIVSGELWEALRPVRREVEATFSVTEADAAQIMQDMLIVAHGLAAIQIGSRSEMTDAALRETLSRMCISLVAGIQVRDGRVNEPQLRMMLSHTDMIPQKKSDTAARRSSAEKSV